MATRTPPAVLVVGVVLAALLAAACGGSPPELVGRGILGGTDTDILSVPLEDVHVETFVAGTVPLSVIEEERLLALRDAIPPLDNPLYDPAADGDWLQPDGAVQARRRSWPDDLDNFVFISAGIAAPSGSRF